MERALSPQVRCLVLSGCERRFASDDRRLRVSVVVEQVSEVGRGLVMEGFVGEEEELEVDSMWDREPV